MCGECEMCVVCGEMYDVSVHVVCCVRGGHDWCTLDARAKQAVNMFI